MAVVCGSELAGVCGASVVAASADAEMPRKRRRVVDMPQSIHPPWIFKMFRGRCRIGRRSRYFLLPCQFPPLFLASHDRSETNMRTITTAVILLLSVSVMAHAQEERAKDEVQVRGIFGTAAFLEAAPHRVFGAVVDFRLVGGLRVGPEVLYHIGQGPD